MICCSRTSNVTKNPTFFPISRLLLPDPETTSLVELGFLKYDDPRFASTVAAYEEDAFRAAVSPNTFTTGTLLWYAEALRVCGRIPEAYNLLDALSESCDYTGREAQICIFFQKHGCLI